MKLVGNMPKESRFNPLTHNTNVSLITFFTVTQTPPKLLRPSPT